MNKAIPFPEDESVDLDILLESSDDLLALHQQSVESKEKSMRHRLRKLEDILKSGKRRRSFNHAQRKLEEIKGSAKKLERKLEVLEAEKKKQKMKKIDSRKLRIVGKLKNLGKEYLELRKIVELMAAERLSATRESNELLEKLAQILETREAVLLVTQDRAEARTDERENIASREYLIDSLDFPIEPRLRLKLIKSHENVFLELLTNFVNDPETLAEGVSLSEKIKLEALQFIGTHVDDIRILKVLNRFKNIPKAAYRLLVKEISDDKKVGRLTCMLPKTEEKCPELLLDGLKILFVTSKKLSISHSIIAALENAGVQVRFKESSRRNASMDSYDFVLVHSGFVSHSDSNYYRVLTSSDPEKFVFLPRAIRKDTVVPHLLQKITLKSRSA